MSDTQTISVKIIADAGALKTGLADAAAAVKTGAKDISGGLSTTGQAAKKVAEEHTSLVTQLREFKTEQMADAKVARFYAGELAAIIPGADGVKGAVQGLMQVGIEGAAGGLGLGLGLEVATLALNVLTERFNEALKQTQELRQIGNDAWFALADGARGVERAIAPAVSKTDELARSLSDRATAKVRELAEAKKKLDEGGGAREFFSGFTLGLIRSTSDQIKDVDTKIKEVTASLSSPEAKAVHEQTQAKEQGADNSAMARERLGIEASTSAQIVQIQAHLEAERERIGNSQLGTAEARARLLTAIEAKAAEDKRRVEAAGQLAYRTERLALLKDTLSAEEQLRRESAAKIAALREKRAQSKGDPAEQGRIDGLIGLEQQLQERQAQRIQMTEALELGSANLTLTAKREEMGALDVIQAQGNIKVLQLHQQLELAKSDATKAAVLARIDLVKFETGEQIRLAEGAHQKWVASVYLADEQAQRASLDRKIAQYMVSQNRMDEEIKRFSELSKTAGASVGQAFADMATGAKDFGRAIDQVAKDSVGAMIDMAIKMLEAYAISAEGAAAFSQMGIPLIGPVLAIGAAATAGAFIKGMISSLPSASGGYDIPSGLNPITQLHEKEMVLPASLAQPLREQLAGGGGMGGNLTVQIHAMDGASVHRVVSSPAFANAIREAKRNGASL